MSRTASPTVFTVSASSSATWIPKLSSNARITSTRRAELTSSSSRMFVSGLTEASTLSLRTYGLRIPMTFSITSCSLILDLPLCCRFMRRYRRPFAKDHARVDVAEAEPGLDQGAQARIVTALVRHRPSVRANLGMEILAIERGAELFRVDARAASRGALRIFEHEDARSACRHEAGGGGAHRTRCLVGCVVEAATEHHPHGVEGGPDVMARAFRAAAQHALGAAGTDALEPERDRFRAGGAGAGIRRHLVAEREQTGDTRGRAARHDLLDDGRAEPADLRRVGERHQRLTYRVHAADARADHGAGLPVNAVVARLRPHQAGILPCLGGPQARRLQVGGHRPQLGL